MSDTNQTPTSPENWNEFVEEMNRNALDALERNVEAQTTFVEAWMDALGDASSEETVEDGLEGYARAYEVWMGAAQDQFERMSDAIEGEDVPPEEFRDIWLNTANEAFKEVMSTTAFAATTGETVESALELRQEVDETAEQTLHALGFPTEGDVEEVGERLVELERRQHGVEQGVDGVGDRLDGLGQRFDSVEDRLATVDDRLARFGDRFDGVEENVEGVASNVESVDDRLDELDEVSEQLDELDEVGDRLDGLEERVESFEERFDRLDETLDEIADAVEDE
jgi:methyl-accepting chemotaxis protein